MLMRKNNELQIEIDDVYGCPGHCPGCVLSSIEKKSIQADMNINTFNQTIGSLEKFILKLSDLEKINITYGIGDHFLMNDSYLKYTYQKGSELIKKFNDFYPNDYHQSNGIFYSSSMIGKYETIMQKVHFLKSLEDTHQTPIYILAVLDPKHLYHKKFSEVYHKNIIDSQKILKKIDLSINLSIEAIHKITPEELFMFAIDNHFHEVTINWTPTEDNFIYSYMHNHILTNWLINFFEISVKTQKEKNITIGTSFVPVIMRTIDNLRCKEPEIQTLHESVDFNFYDLSYKSIQIDHLGQFFPKYEAIGDIGHGSRFGFNPIGNVHTDDIFDSFQNKSKYHQYEMMKNVSFKQCQQCDFQKYCANSGFHVYNKIISNQIKNKKNILITEKIKSNEKTGCWHPAKNLFEYFEKITTNK